jgi:hypothetical protein
MKTTESYYIIEGMNEISLAEHGHILTVRDGYYGGLMSVLIRTEKKKEPWHLENHKIYVVKHGDEIPESIAGKPDERKLRYISTFVIQKDKYVYHAFEVLGE